MKRLKTKTRISISLNKDLDIILNDKFDNKSRYIEYLLYQDLLKNSKNEKIKKIII